jgi:hypothetical protein
LSGTAFPAGAKLHQPSKDDAGDIMGFPGGISDFFVQADSNFGIFV